MVTSPILVCKERIRLAVDYRETTRIYAEFVNKMSELVSLGMESEVDLLRRLCRMSWDAAEKGRLALSRHERDHICDRSDFANSPRLGQWGQPAEGSQAAKL